MHSRYEEMDQQFNDLPLPDEEASWQKMKALLDKDEDDDRIIPPPVFFRSCLGWGLLFAGLIVSWLVIRPDKRWNEDSKARPTSSSPKTSGRNSTGKSPVNKSNHSLVEKTPGLQERTKETKAIVRQQKEIALKNSLIISDQVKDRSFRSVSGKKKADPSEKNKPGLQKEVRNPQPLVGDRPVEMIENAGKAKRSDSSSAITDQHQSFMVTDTAKEKQSIPTNDSSAKKKIQPIPKKKFFLTAGIGEQQQIPIAGQTAVPYSHYGRKGSLSDYVPSVYFRFHREERWFVQGEFRYGAAQSVKEFSYNRKTKFDTSSMNLTTTTQRLKKTYYHQLPLSFNYYVRPNLSVGLGGMYSRFYGAITEQETKIQNLPTGTQTVLKQIVPIKHFTDSFLYKTQVHVLVQADYQWKKFSFGLRYTKDIQPYIKYIRPDGTVDEEKNQSLQLMIRYRLWQSKRT